MTDAREFWKVAATFPPDKEAVYPEHALAHEFDVQAAARAGIFSRRVLEYGCGGGSDTISLLRRGAEVTFTDIVASNVATTEARVSRAAAGKRWLWSGVLFHKPAPLLFDDTYFDSVNCHGVLHHIPLPTMHEVISEFFRVLKRGGHLYAMLYTEHLWARGFNAPLPSTDAAWATRGGSADQATFGGFTDGGSIARAYTVESGTEIFARAGFEVVKTTLYNNDDFRVFKCLKPL